MKLLITVLCCLLSTAAYCREDIIEKMAVVICDCMKENEDRKHDGSDNSSFTACAISNLDPYRKSIRKLIRNIIREDNEGDELNASEAFKESYEEAAARHCPGQSVDFTDIFYAIIQR